VQNDRWMVTEGLKPGDGVIVEGLQHARPGEPVEIDASPLAHVQNPGQ